MRLRQTNAAVIVLVVAFVLAPPAHRASLISGTFADQNGDGFDEEDLALSITNNWDGVDFDCERDGTTVHATWVGPGPAARGVVPEELCLGRTISMTFDLKSPIAEGEPFQLELACEPVASDSVELGASFCIGCTSGLRDLVPGMNPFDVEGVTTVVITTVGVGIFVNAEAPDLTTTGTVIGLVVAAFVLGVLVLRRLS